MGEEVALGGDLEGAEGVSAPPAPPLLLASTSPQRRAILEQLGIPFHAVAPRYEEDDERDADAVELVCEHARGKAQSVAAGADGRPVLGVDTAVVLDGVTYGKPSDAADAERMLEVLSGRTHVVVSGLCLVTPGWELVEHDSTNVTFRPLPPRELAVHVAHGEWQGRAGGYAIQGRGGALVERIEGDYLNVVGLPAALLVCILAERFPGVYGFG
jgi:septum formation protein